MQVRIAAVTDNIRSFTTLPYIFTTLTLRAHAARCRDGPVVLYADQRRTRRQRRRTCRPSCRRGCPTPRSSPTAEFRKRSLDYWLFETGAGAALIAGAALGMIVGVVIVAQTLYSSTKDHLNEFATLRALGASAGYIIKVILIQAMLSALIGYALGMVLSLLLIWASKAPTLLIVMTPNLALPAVRADRRDVRLRGHLRHLQSDPHRSSRGVQQMIQTAQAPSYAKTRESSSILEARGIVKVLGRGAGEVRALKGVNIELMPGELTLLMGPSGSGKTTLLSILGCILSPTEGRLRLAGQSTEGLSPRASRNSAPQARRLRLPVLQSRADADGAENVMLALDLRGASLRQAPALAIEALEAVGLGHRSHAMPCKLQRRRETACVDCPGSGRPPSVILADEPTAALDSENGKAVMALLAEVAKERAGPFSPSPTTIARCNMPTASSASRMARSSAGPAAGNWSRVPVPPDAPTEAYSRPPNAVRRACPRSLCVPIPETPRKRSNLSESAVSHPTPRRQR